MGFNELLSFGKMWFLMGVRAEVLGKYHSLSGSIVKAIVKTCTNVTLQIYTSIYSYRACLIFA